MPEITLLRHGRPSYELKGAPSAGEFGDIVEKYNQSGIQETPPSQLKQFALQHHYIVCSDLLRSIESAHALGINKIHITDPIFREVAMPYYDKGALRMSISKWSVLFRVMSIFGFAKNGESLAMAKQRAKTATSKLVSLAEEHSRVLLVGHGFMNYFIAKELLVQNWSGPAKTGKDFWTLATYQLDK
ncbi:MAG: histidine phosphatase family protein [Gammaproteobacteria bacterium]|nr:histidine phosphatase family protein [Gammaproteobacteria bacterium]